MTSPVTSDTVNASSPIKQVFPIGNQWPTIDPFLFVAHHRDDYPAGNDQLGPAATLAGRRLGQDFDDIDGWNMYHGRVVPGFPQHPHRGFETITYVRRGLIDHSDSLGATARFGRGDTQWMTAGSGVVHCEMFPLVDDANGNPLELFQIWLNLPAANKMVDPYFTMFWDADTPRLSHTDANGRSTQVTVIAGTLGDAKPKTPPPDSWASVEHAKVGLWHLSFEGDATWTLTAADSEVARVVYVFGGSSLTINGQSIDASNGVLVDATADLDLQAGATGVECLVMQGRPIGEPVVQHGPFVMNDNEGIQQAFNDYQRTQFGGWPWPSDGPVHAPSAGRFAIHPDGRREEPTETSS